MSYSLSGDMIPLAVPDLCGCGARYLQEWIETGFVSLAGPFIERFVSRKRESHARYEEAPGDLPGADGFPGSSWGESVRRFLGIMPPPGVNAAFCGLPQAQGIEARNLWNPVHVQPQYRDAPAARMDTTESLWHRIVTLPCSTGLSAADQERVIDAVWGLAARSLKRA